MKVKLFDKSLWKCFFGGLSAIGVVTSLIFLFVDIPGKYKPACGVSFAVSLVAIFLLLWYRANHLNGITLTINGSVLEICEGDLFECDGFKVLAFNEFFDTQVDGEIIFENTLNGKFILKEYPDPAPLDEKIENDHHAAECITETVKRTKGKNQRYKLGTIVKDGQYFLLGFSKFDGDNRAYLEMDEYVTCLMNMWNECDIHYGGNSVVLPLLGAGITRFRGYENISDQELLEILIWTFKVSRIRFQYPAKAKIVLTKTCLDKINLYKIKSQFEA